MALNSRYPFGIGVSAWLLVAIIVCVMVTFDHVSNSGAVSSLCMPGLSIRCEPNDCGSLYVRCGRNQKRQEVPGDKVCYKGALISVNCGMGSSELLTHNCRERTSDSRNSTIEFDLKACNCPSLCSGTYVCVCYCKSRPQVQTTCSNNGQRYSNRQQAKCCLPSCQFSISAAQVSSSWFWSLWTEALDFGRVLIQSSFKQICDSLRDRFTFPPTMEADACCTREVGKCNEC